jgi:hypothetical protein
MHPGTLQSFRPLASPDFDFDRRDYALAVLAMSDTSPNPQILGYLDDDGERLNVPCALSINQIRAFLRLYDYDRPDSATGLYTHLRVYDFASACDQDTP